MNSFAYSVELGAPCANKIVYDERHKRIETQYVGAEYGADELFYVSSPSREITLVFRVTDAAVIAAQADFFDLDAALSAVISLPQICEGTLKIKGFSNKGVPTANYLDLQDTSAVYDEDKGVVLFGKCCGDDLAVRVSDNLYAVIDGSECLKGVYIEL